MADYRLAEGGGVILQGRTWIPPDEKNGSWRTYQEWLAKGNEPDALLLPAALPDPRQVARDAIAAVKDLAEMQAALVSYFDAVKV